MVTAEKMKYLDKKASLDYGIPEDRLMENAGKAAALETMRIARKELGRDPDALNVVICSGKGNNGGDGLVAARYFKAAGTGARVFILKPGESGYGKLVASNIKRARAAGVKVSLVAGEDPEYLSPEFEKADILLDALLGISAVGRPVGPVRRVIQLMNKSAKPIISVDIPSGLNPDTGRRPGVCITARHTLTPGFAKTGLIAPRARKNTGRIKVLDIGYPAALAEEAGK